jgi:hypothetical protein
LARAQIPPAEEIEFFEKTIRPLLHDNCHSCHGPTKQRGNLRLDSREAILRGGDSGPAVTPGQPEKSLLVRAIRYGDDVLRMPPRSKLAAAQIEALVQWIGRGAVWPARAPVHSASPAFSFDLHERSQHWCWQPLRLTSTPLMLGANCNTLIDAFLEKSQRTAGVQPAQPAGRAALLRRVTFDLIGLPPTRDEIAAFLADTQPGAFERVVDRLLASPHYGERWARHWLDLVRYAETMGHEFDIEIPEAYRYRDYAIRAFNADVPYDQMVLEHVAGDLLEKPRLDPDGANASIQATAFWFLGQGKHSPVDVRAEEADRLDNQIDVFSKTFLGLTVACARCHDHKFDAITTADYYALTSYLLSSHQQLAFLDSPETLAAALSRLRAVQDRLQSLARTSARTEPAAEIRLPKGAKLFEDFRSGFAHWYVSGQAFGAGPTSCPTPVLHLDGKPRVVLEPAGVVHSGLLDDRLAGALRSPTFTIAHKYIWLHLGGKGGQVSIVIDGFEQIRDPIYGGLRFSPSTGETRVWRAVDVSMWLGHRAFIELADDGPGYLTIDAIAFSDKPPADPEPRTASDIDLPAERLSELAEAKKAAERLLPRPNRLPALETATPWPAHVAIRGNPNSFGAATPARFLAVYAGTQGAKPQCGTRLDLAQQMLSSARALLARVFVNRLWKEHFGEGLVRTPDNFGKVGEPPTEPELLDYLAGEFIRRGWSIKQMHRLLVLSEAYQRSNQPGPDIDIKDPQNRLQSFQPIRRLEAECVRDAILAVSTRLDQRFYGPSVAPFLNAHMQGRGRPNHSGPLDGAGRRSIYLNVRRNFLSPLLVAFDYPVPFSTLGRRASSNVPAQALILLNDPFVIGQARVWADRLLRDADCTANLRIDRVYEEALGRPPTESEAAAALSFINDRSAGASSSEPRDAWADLCHVLFNVKEFIFVP